jgi:hypothetical protein
MIKAVTGNFSGEEVEEEMHASIEENCRFVRAPPVYPRFTLSCTRTNRQARYVSGRQFI